MASPRTGVHLGAAIAVATVAGIGWWVLRSHPPPEPAPPPFAPVPSPQPAPAKPIHMSPLSEGKCTFDVREQPVERVLRYVRDAAGAPPIEVVPELAGARITLVVKAMPWREAVVAVAKAAGGVVAEGPGVVRIVRPAGAPVDDMVALVAKCRESGAAYRRAEEEKDFLKMAAAKRSLHASRDRLGEEMRKRAASEPEFPQPELRERYEKEVRAPLEKIDVDFAEVLTKRVDR